MKDTPLTVVAELNAKEEEEIEKHAQKQLELLERLHCEKLHADWVKCVCMCLHVCVCVCLCVRARVCGLWLPSCVVLHLLLRFFLQGTGPAQGEIEDVAAIQV